MITRSMMPQLHYCSEQETTLKSIAKYAFVIIVARRVCTLQHSESLTVNNITSCLAAKPADC